jgi:anti-sigma-K factor RskA
VTDQIRDLAASHALGALTAAESAELASAIERDPQLAGALAEYRVTVAVLEANVTRDRPSHDLFPGILSQVDTAPTGTAAVATSRRRNERWSWRRAVPAFAVGAAATAVVFAAALALDSNGALGTPDAVAAVQGAPEYAGVHGKARIYDSGSVKGVLRLELADVPAAPRGEHYEVWVLRPSAGDSMEAVGVFNPSSPDVSLELGLPGPGDYIAFDISLEPDAGSPEHSGTSVAGGKFGAPPT